MIPEDRGPGDALTGNLLSNLPGERSPSGIQVGNAQESHGRNDLIVLLLLVRLQLGKVMVWLSFHGELYPLSTSEPPA